MRFSAWYGILVGALMIGQWAFSIVSGGVPEFQTAPWEIGFHLAAEISTALMLMGGGIAVLKSTTRAKSFLLVALGMVIYSEIVSPGYFAQLGQWPLVVMFGILLVGAVIAAGQLLNGDVKKSLKSEVTVRTL